MNNVLVTGGSGFIGGHLVSKLPQQRRAINLAVRHNFLNTKNLPVKVTQVGEIDQTTDWGTALNGVDVVIHLAARAHQLNDQATNPEAEFQRINCEGTKNLAKQAIAAGVKHFIFISSIGAMATLSEQILTEQTVCNPDSPYGRSKLKAEEALIELCKGSPMTWTILRPTLVYGPGNPGNMERLLKLVNKGLPLPFGAFKNQRSLLYVDNFVDAIITCIDHPNAKNQIFILSDGEDLSTPDLIRRIAKSLGKPANLLPISSNLLKLVGQITGKSDAIARLLGSLQVDSSKIRQMLDWTPPYTVDQGLQATADWFKQR